MRSPSWPAVIAAMNPVGTHASRRACSTRPARTTGVSTTGLVFGIARIAVNPPVAAARVPDATSSSSSSPGVRRWTCGSTRPGKTRGRRPRSFRDLCGRGSARSRRSLPRGCGHRARRRRGPIPGRRRGRRRSGGRPGLPVRRRGAPSGHLLPGRRATTSGATMRSAASASAFPGPASRSYRTAIRTTRPALTWSTIRDAAESATSGAISTPRLIGPGCMTSWLGRSRADVTPHTAAYSVRLGTYEAPGAIRSRCMRRT